MPSTNGRGSSSDAGGRVALYLRVSSDEQRERQTIETQRAFLTEYCRLYELEVAEVYADDGVSGTIPLHERPEGRRLLEDAQAGRFETLLVYRLDRLGRSLLVIVDAHDRFQVDEVELRSATEPIDTSTPSGRLIFQMLASFAEFQRGTIRERTQHGLHRAFRNGKHTGRIPYGYDIDEDGRFRVVEEEAAVVREIISNIAGGSTLYKEVQRLNDLGLPGPGLKYRGKERKHSAGWTRTTVGKLVHQSAYGGMHRIQINGGKESVEKECPPVVTPELQQQALARLAENRRQSRRSSDRKYLLSGLIRCVVCGSAFVGHPSSSRGKTRYYYVCDDNRPGRQKKAPKGHVPYVRAEWLEDLVWQDVKRFLENPGEVLERLREQIQRDEQGKALLKRHEDLTKRLGQKETEKDRYVRLYAKGYIDDAELATYLEDLKIQTQNLRLLLNSVEAEIAGENEQKHLAQTTEAWLSALRERTAEIEAGTQEAYSARRELVRLLVEVIVVDRNEEGRTRVQITYRFGPPREEQYSEAAQSKRVDALENSVL